jgi:site-specific DNA recombinase
MSKPRLNCAIYTRKSSDEGLEQSFNSLDAQREACEAFELERAEETLFINARHSNHSVSTVTHEGA